VRYAEIPAGDYPPIQQACVVLKSSKNQVLATKFETYLRSEEVRKIFEGFGFEAPAQGKPTERARP
jgi:ABC-type molybdate transport system substrate-binding protein